MKLIDITPYFHPKSGGIRRYILEKIKFLETEDVEHVLIIPGKERRLYYMASTKVYEVPSYPIPFTGGYRFFSSFSEIKEILEIEKPTVVELGGTYQPIPFIKSESFLLSVFYHADVEAELSLAPAPSFLKKLLLEHTIRKRLAHADVILTPSKKQEKFLRTMGLEKVKTVNLGVDTNIFNPSKRNPYLRKMLGVGEDKFLLLYVGRLSMEKNINLLIELFEHLDPTLFHLLIVGDGPLRRDVEKLSRKFPNLTYMGYVSNEEELASIYASSDIYISTSQGETFGLSFLEAQACGCLLVALDMGLESQPFKEFLAKDLSVEAFYQALIKAVNSLSLKLREEISSYIEKTFSWERTFRSLLEVYSESLTVF